jgi:GTPase SAR1 family protein
MGYIYSVKVHRILNSINSVQMKAIDEAYRKLEEFERTTYQLYKDEDINESDTRSKVLDYIIKDILGWNETDILREGFVKDGYFDYELRTSTFNFLVEAKKNYVEFELPQKGNEVKLRTIYKSNEEVVNQIRSYLFERSLQYGVITNGHQFIIASFVSYTGADWKDNDCIYFKSFSDIIKNFPEFYGLLSRDYVLHYGRIKIFVKERVGKTIARSKQLPHYGEKLNRNNISSQLIPILSRFFEEIYKNDVLNSKEVLKECYVENEDIKKYSAELSSFFIDQPPTFDSRISPVQNTKNTQKQIKEQLFLDDYTPDPVILIGTAGAGKTTFIRNFIENELTNNDKKKRPIIYIDFRKFTRQNIFDTTYLYSKIIDALKETYPDLNLHKINVLKEIYKVDIKNRKEGSWADLIKFDQNEKLERSISEFLDIKLLDPLTHLERISSYLINQRDKKLCLIFDNVDQLKEDEQRELFLLAHSVKRSLNCIVITSLREGYFYRWKDKPPFNAYHSTIFHITAPPYGEVLKRRIAYILNNFEFPEVELSFANKTVDFEKGSLRTLFQNLYDTLFERENSEILNFLRETSYPNIRDGLEMFQTFLLSGHTHISEYMAFEYGKGSRSGIPFWEFIKSVALDSNYYFNSSDSKITNLFLPSSQNTNHFTKIRILHYLRNQALKTGRDLTFFAVIKLIEDFVRIGYSKDVIIEELNYLYDRNLIITSEYSSDVEESEDIKDDSKVSISSIGNYYITFLIKKNEYIDLSIVETPIYDSNAYGRIEYVFPESDKYGNRDLLKRVETMKEFLKYLEVSENFDLNRAKQNDENEALHMKIVEDIATNVNAEHAKINHYLNKRKN